jgi:hypothetical protein
LGKGSVQGVYPVGQVFARSVSGHLLVDIVIKLQTTGGAPKGALKNGRLKVEMLSGNDCNRWALLALVPTLTSRSTIDKTILVEEDG